MRDLSPCGFGHKVKFVGHKVKFVGHKMRILSVINEICAHDFMSTERLQKRNPMISVGFARVSKKRPCRICGKPTYCGFSRDEGTSICMRISAGFRRLSRNGGNIHVHPENSIHHDSTQQFSSRLANQFRRRLLKLEMLFFKS